MDTATTTAPRAADPDERKHYSPIWHVLTALAIVVGVYLRWDHLGQQSLWFDEGYTAWMIGNPVEAIISYIRADTAPPLYYLLLHFWVKIFGTSEAALRSMSAVLMTVTLFLGVAVAKRLVKTPPALAAASWALAISYYQVQFAKEARAYALTAFLIVAAFYCLQRHVMSAHRRWLFPIALLLAAAMYTHNMMAPYLLCFAPTWLIVPGKHSTARRWKDGLIAAGIVAVLYSPWAIFCLSAQIKMVSSAFWTMRPNKQVVLRMYSALVGVWEFQTWEFLVRHHIHTYSLREYMGLGLLLAATILAYRRRKNEVLALLLLGIGPPMLITVYSLIRQPILVEKTFLASSILLPILVMIPVGLSWKWIPRPFVGAGAVLVLAFMFLTLIYWRRVEKEDWRGAAAIVASMPEHRRLIVFCGNDGELPFDYYYNYRPGDIRGGSPEGFFDRNPPKAMIRVVNPDDVNALAAKIGAEHFDEVVLVESHSFWSDSHFYTLHMLEGKFPHEKLQAVNQMMVFRFTK